jgi:hypothetical protein
VALPQIEVLQQVELLRSRAELLRSGPDLCCSDVCCSDLRSPDVCCPDGCCLQII